MSSSALTGHYAAWNYFQSVPSLANRAFVARFKRRFGADRVTSDPMEAAYCAVHLWAQAAMRANSESPALIRDALRGRSFAAPSGAVYVDPETQHLWKTVRIGQITADGQFNVVWDSGRPVRPEPYPTWRSRAEWDAFLTQWQQRWHGHWYAS
jgi:urea transport system substrate-binding protein